jgi:hypothetical protein
VAKAYVIPIDQHGVAYLGVKALTSPYGNPSVYCPGCPTVFGGNVEQGQQVSETLYLEARQESHYKIDLNQTLIAEALRPGGQVNSFFAVHNTTHNQQPMTFYVLRGDFVFHENPYTPLVVLRKPEYGETTGHIVKVPLRGKNFQSPQAAAEAAVAAMPEVLRNVIPPEALRDFFASHSATALMMASRLA